MVTGGDCGTCGVAGQWQCLACPRREAPVIRTGPAQAWWVPLPRCEVHGPMKLVGDDWTCLGWDGEGCPERISAEVWTLKAQPLGEIEPLRPWVPAEGQWSGGRSEP